MGMMISALVLDYSEVHVAVLPRDSWFWVLWALGDAGNHINISYDLVNHLNDLVICSTNKI